MKQTFRCILADEMGLGKTVQVAGLINDCPGIKKVLIVCPASLKGNWLNELNHWLKRSFTKEVIEGKTGKPLGCDITIVNYDILNSRLDSLLEVFTPNSLGHSWDLIVWDEAHYLKNLSAARTKASRKLFFKSPRLVFLTGTPVVNRPCDFFTLLNAWGVAHDQRKYEIRFCGGHIQKMRFGPKTVTRWFNLGATHLDELHQLAKPVMLRRLKKDVLSELPAKFRQVIELDGQDQFGSVELAGKWWENLDGKAVSATAQAKKLCGVAKIPQVIAHVKSVLEEKNKVIVFAYHKDVVHGIAEAFKGNSVVITGETPSAARTGIVKSFQENPNINVFIGNIVAAGVGITLTASDIVVFAELDWVPGNMAQAEDRAHRIGQQNNVLVQYLVTAGVDAEIGKALAEKIDVIEAAIGGKK